MPDFEFLDIGERADGRDLLHHLLVCDVLVAELHILGSACNGYVLPFVCFAVGGLLRVRDCGHRSDWV